MKFIGVSEFRDQAEIGDNTEEIVIERLIEWVSASLEASMDRWLVKGVYAETIQPMGNLLYLKAYPIDLAASFSVTDDGVLLDGADYRIASSQGIVRRIVGSYAQPGYDSVSLSYTGGYAEDGNLQERVVLVPDDIKHACFMQTIYYWRNRKDLGLNNMSVAGVSISMAPVDWLPAVKETIKRYRRIII